MELVYTGDSKSPAERLRGSSPLPATRIKRKWPFRGPFLFLATLTCSFCGSWFLRPFWGGSLDACFFVFHNRRLRLRGAMMRIKGIRVVVISFLVAVFGGISPYSWADRSLTSKELYATCHALLGTNSSGAGDDSGSGLCIGYFSAVIDSFIAYDSLGNLPRVLSCVPSGISEGDAVTVFVSYLQKNQDQLDDPAISTVLKAFSEKYPPTCQFKE